MEAEERPLKLRKLDEATNDGAEVEVDIPKDGSDTVKVEDDQSLSKSSPSDLQGPNPQALKEPSRDALKHSSTSHPNSESSSPGATLSKTQLKKLKRQREWEANKEARKAWKKEKRQESQKRKRQARDEEAAAISEEHPFRPREVETTDSASLVKGRRHEPVQLPITFILDCGFDDLMMDKERISLASQVTRCYSDNSKSPFRAHLAVSSFNGHLKDRFDNVLSGHHRAWKGMRFYEESFAEVSKEAKKWMSGPSGGKLAGSLAYGQASNDEAVTTQSETVYLTSESPNELSRLRPHSTYIIGGLVDRNRHKGVCYKRALDHGVQTARLPIGKYMKMLSRFVLATNHVNEIMLKWLSNGDWGQSLSVVIPKRKGGELRARNEGEGSGDGGKSDIQEDSQCTIDKES